MRAGQGGKRGRRVRTSMWSPQTRTCHKVSETETVRETVGETVALGTSYTLRRLLGFVLLSPRDQLPRTLAARHVRAPHRRCWLLLAARSSNNATLLLSTCIVCSLTSFGSSLTSSCTPVAAGFFVQQPRAVPVRHSAARARRGHVGIQQLSRVPRCSFFS